MTYSFDKAPDRRGTGSKKWAHMYELKAEEDIRPGVVPMSTADMEFKAAPEIYQALVDYLESTPVLGYNDPTDAIHQAVIAWQAKHHDIKVSPEWLVYTHGVVDALAAGVEAFTESGDGVIIFQPVYHPFAEVIEDHEREIVNVPLLEDEGYYTIDYDAFETAAKKAENKLLIFCSPHNPVGRVWKPEELQRLADIAVENDLYVVSDEIWNDFTRDDQTHTTLATFDPRLDERLVVCTSTSKTFNLAGVKCAISIVPNETTHQHFAEVAETTRASLVNGLGPKAVEAAYTKGEGWYNELLDVIHGNQQYVADTFEKEFPQVKAPVSEGTYCVWIDCRALDIDDETLKEWCIEADCFPTFGTDFGAEGSGFIRLNLACPRPQIETVVNQLIEVFKSHV